MNSESKKPAIHYVLWAVQWLLGLLFLLSGVMKFIMTVEQMTQQVKLPGLLLHFVGAMEILGGIGLILPGLLRIRPGLTPLAACGIVIIMTGAVVITATSIGVAFALLPLIVGILAAFIAYGRWRLASLAGADS